MASFRFVHSADIHLDSPLTGLAGHRGSAVDLIRSAPRQAFDALVSRTIAEEARFLIIAGDLYDGNWKDYQTGLYFVRQMGRLRRAGIPAYVIHGNHDAASQITRKLTLPDNVTVFSARKPETRLIEDLGVALHGQSFATRSVFDNLARNYPPPVSGALNIGILHTGLAGAQAEGHEPYAPCELEELVRKGYDYWALGHIHIPRVLRERPHVVYSGNVQGRHIRESGPRGAYLVEVEDGEIADAAPFHVDLVRWAVVTVSAEGCHSIEDICSRMRDSIERAVSEQAEGRLLACRIEIEGRTAAHQRALVSREHLVSEARAAAVALGDECAWVEKVIVKTRPEDDRETSGDLAGLVGDISDASADRSLLDDLRNDIAAMIAKLPHEVRDSPEDPFLRSAVDGEYDRLVELAAPYASARILAGKE